MTAMLLLALSLAVAPRLAQPDSGAFHQGVDYRIEARLDEATDVLTARARLRYTNNSNAQLDTLWFHLHLNAFRPNSAWARRDLESGLRRFTDLGPDQHAFERLRSVRAGEAVLTPVFPGAPDSTVVGFALPQPLPPGGVVTLMVDWDARLSTLPRRQGRRGRHFDFAQWYPRIAVYDRGGWQVQPLLPQGEFYGEYASWDVTLDLPGDQVVAATGVPVEGDPGWETARAPGSPRPHYRRDVYPARPPESLGLLDGAAETGRKRVRWRAEDTHHFAWTTSPDYIYEGGRDGVALHVLYQPGDTGWAGGVALRRTADALAFMENVFGPYPWPQLTNVHRIESGGTEFPMMVMDGSASEGLIMHEVAHQYVHGILGNNEWREGWLDEGFASFLARWYFEEKGSDQSAQWRASMDDVRALERAGLTQPISLASAEFRDFDIYNAMTYTKPSLVLRMLRALMGEERFRTGIRNYYRQYQLQHVTGMDFEVAMEAAWGQELDWFFDQWIETTATLDYAIGQTSTRLEGGAWVAQVEVLRTGEAWMPVELRVNGETRILDSRERRQVATFRLTEQPRDARLDPAGILLDIDLDNNVRPFNSP